MENGESAFSTSVGLKFRWPENSITYDKISIHLRYGAIEQQTYDLGTQNRNNLAMSIVSPSCAATLADVGYEWTLAEVARTGPGQREIIL